MLEFCQRLTLNPGTRNGDDVFREWTKRMVAAIRAHDQTHLITMGMLPFPGAYKVAAEQLDGADHVFVGEEVVAHVDLAHQRHAMSSRGGIPPPEPPATDREEMPAFFTVVYDLVSGVGGSTVDACEMVHENNLAG